MNYTIKVDGKLYDVKILDLHATPILVVVDGTEIEVWPEQLRASGEDQTPPTASSGGVSVKPTPVSAPRTGSGQSAPVIDSNPKAVTAPLPGVIIAIKIKAGETVSTGQELLVIEAMKMKNMIRANRSGKIATIAVNVGETVQHHDLLIEYES